MSPINFIFFIFGVIISVPLIIFGTSYFSDKVSTLAVIALSAVIVSVFLSLLIISNRERILRKLYGTAKIETDDIVSSIQKLGRNVINRDLDKSLESSDEIVRTISARYTWFSARKWMLSVTVGVLAVFVGLAGTALIFKQNYLLDKQNLLLSDHGEKLKKQNQLLDTQNQLSEASRRSSLIFELTSILDSIDIEITAQDKSLGEKKAFENERQCPDESNSKNKRCPKRKISPRLKGRIAALSRSLKPYYFLEVNPIDTSFSQQQNTVGDSKELLRTPRPLSPERGQLLISLLSNGLEVRSMATSYDFTHADLRNVNLHNTNLLGANLDGAQLESSYLVGATLEQASLMSANLKKSKLFEANFRAATLIRANFIGADLTAADFSMASMRWSNIGNANMTRTKINRTVLYGADLSGVQNLTAEQIQEACIDLVTTKLPRIVNFDITNYVLHSNCEKI